MSKEKVEFLTDIHNFISDSKLFLNNILTKLSWSVDSLNDNGCSSREVFNVVDNSRNEIAPGSDIVNVLPCRSSDISLNIEDELPKSFKESKGKTTLELLSQQRDMKRRRVSYKGRIHTKNRSHNEIMREVIAQQMESFENNVEGDRSSTAASLTNSISNEPIANFKDVSDIRVENQHSAWKHVCKEVRSLENDCKTDKSTLKDHSEHTYDRKRCEDRINNKHKKYNHPKDFHDYDKTKYKQNRDKHTDYKDRCHLKNIDGGRSKDKFSDRPLTNQEDISYDRLRTKESIRKQNIHTDTFLNSDKHPSDSERSYETSRLHCEDNIGNLSKLIETDPLDRRPSDEELIGKKKSKSKKSTHDKDGHRRKKSKKEKKHRSKRERSSSRKKERRKRSRDRGRLSK